MGSGSGNTSVQVVWTGIHMKKDFTWDFPTGVRFVDISPNDIIRDCSEKTCNLLKTKSNHVIF